MTQRTLLLILPCLVLALLLSAAPGAHAQYFTINHFHADITIDPDGTVEVTETIRLTFDRQRHGIYHDLPIKYQDDRGNTLRTPLKVISVRDENNRARRYEVIRKGSTARVKIGRGDRYVSGRQVYIIRYRVERVLQFFDDHDELYWNVTGNAWKAPIEAVDATITVATDQHISTPQGACYTGRYGSNETVCSWTADGNKAKFTCDRPLKVGEGFTIAYGWDKGIVSEPSAADEFWYRVNPAQNWPILLPIVAFLCMFIAWYRKGRDPKVREAVLVRYEPPEVDGRPLTAAEVGTMIDERLDQRDISAAIVGLAEKGYLTIEETEGNKVLGMQVGGDYFLNKTKEADPELTPFERKLMAGLFEGNKDTVAISNLRKKFYKNIPELHKRLYKELVRKGFFARNPDKVRGHYGLIGFLLIFGAGFVAFITASEFPVLGFICAVVAGVIIMAFGKAMPAKTRRGALAKADILGFQEFMIRADKDRIERMGGEIFYKYMPYAIALDVTDRWADAFAGMDQKPPRWYVASHGVPMFNAHRFASHINESTTAIGQAVYAAPRGSGLSGGGGGGGFSGGGGGGGGGGSW